MTAASALDDRTAAAIRDAISAASRGRLAEACAIGEQALAGGGDVVALNAMLGMLRRQSGNIEASIAHLRAAHAARPSDSKIAVNLVTALAEASENREALDLLTDELVSGDATMHLERLRGFLRQSLEEFSGAVDSYERVVTAFPQDWEAWNNLGNARRCTGDFAGSLEALERAAKLQPDSPPIRLNLALAIGASGNLPEAERLLRELVKELPRETQPLQELHALLREQSRDEEALEAIEEAVRRDPVNITLLLALGSHLSQMQRYGPAEDAYRRAIEVDPMDGAANLGLAIVLELTNRVEELLDLVRVAEERRLGPESLEFIRAFGHRREKRYEEGLKALEQVPEAIESARRYHLQGQLLQGAGQYDEAFAVFERMNQLTADDPSMPDQRGARYRNMIMHHMRAMRPEMTETWSPEREPYAGPTPTFLVGFPRSGTTLLDTMLMGHPEIEVLEEEPTMRQAVSQLPPPGELPTLEYEAIRAARDVYWQVAKSLTPLKPGSLLVDKNPLAMNSLPQIKRLFPEARIILALRHPCDVVLSCYITNFRPNDGMASFLHLDTAAELYDLSFRYFERAEQILKLPLHSVVYERVVADREQELKALFDFLGLDWHDAVLDHETTAKGRGRIKTASYSQVVEPIYTRASGRWWNYRRQLEPVFPTLAPWVEKFGYSLDDPTKFPQEPIAL